MQVVTESKVGVVQRFDAYNDSAKRDDKWLSRDFRFASNQSDRAKVTQQYYNFLDRKPNTGISFCRLIRQLYPLETHRKN